MFTVQEFVTAAELKLPLPLILWHNDGYKQIRDDMREANVPRIAVDGLSPDYMALAKAMHCHAVEPTSLNTLSQAVGNAFEADRPTIILVREDSDWLA
jgi:thiamine pyrophosphate-dependent acetolactate synthase large subunit-like protein